MRGRHEPETLHHGSPFRTPGYFDGRPAASVDLAFPWTERKVRSNDRRAGCVETPRPRDKTGNVQLYLAREDQSPDWMGAPLCWIWIIVKIDQGVFELRIIPKPR